MYNSFVSRIETAQYSVLYIQSAIFGITQQVVHSDFVGSRNVSGEKVLDLRDVHGFFDGGVSAADLKESTLQRVVTDHHSEEHSHLIVPTVQWHRDQIQMLTPKQANLHSFAPALLPLQHWVAVYLACSCSIDVGTVSRYPGHTEILDSMNSCRRPSQTYRTRKRDMPWNMAFRIWGVWELMELDHPPLSQSAAGLCPILCRTCRNM